MRSAVCLNCHENSTQLALWDGGIHKKKDVSCNDCHSIHMGPKAAMGYGTTLAPLGYLPGPQYIVCGKCHLDIKAAVNRRSHHPIIEGRINCSSCHQPHGTLTENLLKADSNNQLCYKCHADKRGPYMNEHPPVEENCSICHLPHGGVPRSLFSRRRFQTCARAATTPRATPAPAMRLIRCSPADGSAARQTPGVLTVHVSTATRPFTAAMPSTRPAAISLYDRRTI